MSRYTPDVFYDVSKLSILEKKKLLKHAAELAHNSNVRVDILTGWQREKITMSLSEILKKLKKNSHFVFIHRKGFLRNSGKPLEGEYQIETGFATMDAGPTYYLFIFMEERYLEEFIIKYNLIERQNQ
jgi:hypothetical protein